MGLAVELCMTIMSYCSLCIVQLNEVHNLGEESLVGTGYVRMSNQLIGEVAGIGRSIDPHSEFLRG